jgi:ABC-type sugar transport system substrate-binding protein
LVVEPAVPADGHLAVVIEEARGQGVPVVLLNRSLGGDQPTEPLGPSVKAATGAGVTQKGAPGTEPAAQTARSTKPLVLVKPSPFDSSARQLVASAFRNAKNAHLDPQGGAVLLTNTSGDQFMPDRVAAIRSALKSSGITKIEEISFSKEIEAGSKLLTQKLKADPKLALAFSADYFSTVAARDAMLKIVLDRPFIMAGYAADDTYTSSTSMGDFAAVAVYAPARLLRKAIATGVALAQGRSFPALIEVPTEVDESPPESTTPKSPAFYKKKDEAIKKGL